MLWRKAFIFLILAAVLAGCGFRPLYGTLGRDETKPDVAEALARIDVGLIPDRVGQQVHNGLLAALAPRGHAGKFDYFLKVDLSESISGLAVKKSAFATRADLTLSASFSLFEVASGRVLMSSRARATSSLNILQSEFATLMAENSARQQAVKEIVEDIRLKIAAALERRS